MSKQEQDCYSVIQLGGNLSVVIPKRFAEQLAVSRGDKLRVSVEDGRLVMERVGDNGGTEGGGR